MVSDAVTPGTVQFYNSAEDQAMIGAEQISAGTEADVINKKWKCYV